MLLDHRIKLLDRINLLRVTGRLSSAIGLTLRAEGFPAAVGSMCRIQTRQSGCIDAEVVGFENETAVVMPLQPSHGAAPGDEIVSEPSVPLVGVGPDLLGRVIDGMGRPIDQLEPIFPERFYSVYQDGPPPLSRVPITQPLATGIRAIDAALTVGSGQRVGIFAGTGVGKSVLLGMIARYCSADVVVVALVGERGREVRDFIDKTIGPEGLKRMVVVVSTAEESPVKRVRACFVATAVAEYFRDQGKDVLLLMDSLTRLAMAQRQIGLSAGEPPTTKGYTPSVFSLFPKLLERAGRTTSGSITGFYTVLVEGDDIQEPISDAVRGILDGHVWLSRALASKGHYPAVDVLNSVSRLMVDVVDAEHQRSAQRIREVLGTWTAIEDMVAIGAYTQGSNAEYDVAIGAKPRVDALLRQGMTETFDFAQSRSRLIELATEIEASRTSLNQAASSNT